MEKSIRTKSWNVFLSFSCTAMCNILPSSNKYPKRRLDFPILEYWKEFVFGWVWRLKCTYQWTVRGGLLALDTFCQYVGHPAVTSHPKSSATSSDIHLQRIAPSLVSVGLCCFLPLLDVPVPPFICLSVHVVLRQTFSGILSLLSLIWNDGRACVHVCVCVSVLI